MGGVGWREHWAMRLAHPFYPVTVVQAAVLRRVKMHSCRQVRLDSQEGNGSPKPCGSFGAAYTSCAPLSSSVTLLNKANVVLSNTVATWHSFNT